eukprot:CAMPEP_0174376026 /NCGR_PEP_ID=MMETSP0811_2-20130205/116718_1 /TAXON_ID=73025 ORGANISM="Eutreptiella gymnastica-like, Strain CCMP1594" /NCGR_SAMPLE_ID=MMETSP0811_2 /ASSEMBLY_ACC=CAM_ASM_000667 /LENGTH=164 /DNA_ID=CAMNT_0015526829 /DNA_START=125 /DNA_END=619 /DNA_ORIENTATION=+
MQHRANRPSKWIKGLLGKPCPGLEISEIANRRVHACELRLEAGPSLDATNDLTADCQNADGMHVFTAVDAPELPKNVAGTQQHCPIPVEAPETLHPEALMHPNLPTLCDVIDSPEALGSSLCGSLGVTLRDNLQQAGKFTGGGTANTINGVMLGVTGHVMELLN